MNKSPKRHWYQLGLLTLLAVMILPAVIAMMALKDMNQLSKCEEVAYGASADVSGDQL